MKSLTEFILESNNDTFNFNISKISTGKRDDMLMFQKIQKQLIDNKKETTLEIDCGKLGLCKVSFTNIENNVCDMSIQLKDLGNLIKFDQKVDSEFTNHTTLRDAYDQCMNILNRIKEKL